MILRDLAGISAVWIKQSCDPRFYLNAPMLATPYILLLVRKVRLAALSLQPLPLPFSSVFPCHPFLLARLIRVLPCRAPLLFPAAGSCSQWSARRLSSGRRMSGASSHSSAAADSAASGASRHDADVDEIRLSEHDDAVAPGDLGDDPPAAFSRQRSATRTGLSSHESASSSGTGGPNGPRSALRSAGGRRSEEERVDEGDESALDDQQHGQHSAREPGAAVAPTPVVVEEGWCEDEESAEVYPSPHTRARASRISPTNADGSGGGGSRTLGRQRSTQHRSSSKTDAELPTSATFSSSDRIAEPAVRAIAAMHSAALPVSINPAHAVRERFVDPHGAAAACLKLGHPSNHLLAAASPSASMLAVFELLLHFDTFKNIDLFRQGLYYLRCHFFTLGGVRVDAATVRANAAAAAAGGGGQAESVGGLGASPTASTGITSPQSASSIRSVGVGRGAADSGVDSDVGSLPRSAEEAAALQSQILQWEAAVHELNAPPPKDKEKEKEGKDNQDQPMPTSESLMATAGDGTTGGGSGSSGIQLRKHRLALPYYILSNPKAESGNLFAFADKAVWPPSIQDTSNTFHTRTFRMQYCEQEIVINDACLFRLELNARKRVPVYLEVELMFAEYTIAESVQHRDAQRHATLQVPCAPVGDMFMCSHVWSRLLCFLRAVCRVVVLPLL